MCKIEIIFYYILFYNFLEINLYNFKLILVKKRTKKISFIQLFDRLLEKQ